MPVAVIAACCDWWVWSSTFQLSLVATTTSCPILSVVCNSSVGSANAPGTSNALRVGPRARNNTVMESLPAMMRPPIRTLSPVSTLRRVEVLVRVGVGAPACAQYLPPVFEMWNPPVMVAPPQTIISLSVHTAVCPNRVEGALVGLVDLQLSVLGLYLPPVFKKWKN